MPIESTIEPENRVVISRVTGAVTLEELADYLGKFWADPRDVGFSEIFDWTGIGEIDLSTAELRSLTGPANAFYDDSATSRLALVVPLGEGIRMAKLYRNFRQSRGGPAPEIEIFTELNDARAWVGEA